MTDLATRLKAARTRLEESQAEFGARFGVDQSTIHRWETDGPSDRGPARMLIERTLTDLDKAKTLASRAPSQATAP